MNKFLFFLLTISSLVATAQVININPDKSAEPWLVGGLRVPSDEELADIKVVSTTVFFNKDVMDLPVSQDNSESMYFRPIFNQSDGSCAQSSGVGYTFTYEINRIRNTPASIEANQYPSHYTYNFLNAGNGENGSFYTDGWDIIKANGCPSVATYGGMAITASYWMSGYDAYEQGQENRIHDYFAIDVGTPEGLETLKYWFVNHFDETSFTGGVVNFAAGVSDSFNMIYEGGNSKVIEWGHSVNHAMTFVGYDDSITYDYNNDGQITNNIDINSDGVVDMRDWEQGALIMVNSWGSYWGDGGKAYVMYKTLAESVENGGIHASKVFAINVKETQDPQLTMRVKMTHNSRNKIQIIAGVSTNLSDTAPEHTISFPLFNKQGGANEMNGYNTTPIEISLDVSGLLSFIDAGEDAKFFLGVIEHDDDYTGSGSIQDFSIVDNTETEYICSTHNVSLNNNDITLLSIVTAIDFEAPEIITDILPTTGLNTVYSHQLTAEGGATPYTWRLKQEYNESTTATSYPAITSGMLTPTNNDDGYASKSLDFSFPFYGEQFDQVYISTDGSIVFAPEFNYIRTEDALKSNKIIGVFAHDLLLDGGSHGIYYQGDANSATFRWIATTWADTSATVDVAVTLFPNGEIIFYYGSGISSGLSWASGVSNGIGSYSIASISGANNPSNTKHKMIPDDFPIGMSITEGGIFEGTSPDTERSWDVTFVVTDNNGVSDNKELVFTTSTVSVDDLAYLNIAIYPNPVTDILHIVTEEVLTTICVYDSSSKLLLRNDNNPKSIDLSSLEAGLYFVKFQTEKGTAIQKLIVE